MKYKVLMQDSYLEAGYSLVPIRFEDMMAIKTWRNQQLDILRQKHVITDEQQVTYFETVVAPLFESLTPNQLLFSYLFNGVCIGYGGLVHIDWESRRGEISFLLETERNQDPLVFQRDFEYFLKLLKVIALDANLIKINTEAYDLRPYLYAPLEANGFVEEARLKAHNLVNGRRVDTVIHSYFVKSISAGNKLNVLITSVSRKIPLIAAIKDALNRLDVTGRVHGGDSNEKSLGRYFVDKFWKMPLLNDGSIEAIVNYCHSNEIKAIVPTRDGELLFWATNRDLFFNEGISVMISSPTAVNNTIDKLSFFYIGEKLGFPVIKTVTDIAELQTDLYVVKQRYGAGAKSIGLQLAALDAISLASSLPESLFQPFVKGTEYSIDVYISQAGLVKGAICRKRHLIINGESQVTIIDEVPELAKLCVDFASALDLRGHIVFQALVDLEKKFHIIECNSRFGGASTLSVRAGLDSFYWYFQELMSDGISSGNLNNEILPKVMIRYPIDRFLYTSKSTE